MHGIMMSTQIPIVAPRSICSKSGSLSSFILLSLSLLRYFMAVKCDFIASGGARDGDRRRFGVPTRAPSAHAAIAPHPSRPSGPRDRDRCTRKPPAQSRGDARRVRDGRSSGVLGARSRGAAGGFPRPGDGRTIRTQTDGVGRYLSVLSPSIKNEPMAEAIHG